MKDEEKTKKLDNGGGILKSNKIKSTNAEGDEEDEEEDVKRGLIPDLRKVWLTGVSQKERAVKS